MKKILTKLSISVILNLIILSIFNFSSFAADDNNKCITGDDENKIITIIEEPLSLDDEGDPDSDYYTKTCYRQYESKTDPGKLTRTCDKGSDPDAYCDPVQVIFVSKGGLTMLYGYIGYMYRWAASFIGLIAVAVIIVSSAQISMAGGDSDATKSAKDRIVKSISGLAILFLSSLILYTLNPTFFTL